MEQWSDPDPGSGIKHPGSATLLPRIINLSVKVILDPMIHKDAREKVVRYDGDTIPGDLHHIVPTPSDPRKRRPATASFWPGRDKEEPMELPVPRLVIDKDYVGEPPKVKYIVKLSKYRYISCSAVDLNSFFSDSDPYTNIWT
jgi:hypothetical protein